MSEMDIESLTYTDSDTGIEKPLQVFKKKTGLKY